MSGTDIKNNFNNKTRLADEVNLFFEVYNVKDQKAIRSDYMKIME